VSERTRVTVGVVLIAAVALGLLWALIATIAGP